MSEPNEPNELNKQIIESDSLPQISIPSVSDSPSPISPSSSSSSLLAVSLSHSLQSAHSPSPPTSLSLASLKIVSKSTSHSHSHTSSNESNESNKPNPPKEPSTEPLQNSQIPQTPQQALSLTIPLLAFATHETKTPLLDCGSITLTPEELVDASYDFLLARVIISIEKVLLSQRDEAQKHVEWMEWMEGSEDREEGGIGDGIGRDTLTHGPPGIWGSGVGGVGLGSAMRREKISNFRGGALEIYGRNKSKGLRDRKDRKRRWDFQIYEDPVDREPERPETARISRQARERLEREQIVGGLRAREYVGENQENEEMRASRQTRQIENVGEGNEDVGEIEDEVDEHNPQPQEPTNPSNPTNSSLPPTQPRTPLDTLSRLPKHKECNPINLYIHWKPEPIIPAEYVERTTRMCPIAGSPRRSRFHPQTPEDGDGGRLVNGADGSLAGDEQNKEEATPQTQTQTREINLTTLHPSFPTHEQFTDAYGDGDETNEEGIRELLLFLRERGGRDELIMEYLLL
ncbi:hypothetical protein BCON_0026g00240 [Botryotinia convoluta]|uniref:Uncharacterized protein n=1 Tax=Botryotinia convoluta TaxID=54673 RepID=A0A4Z1IQL0_9HELO|nr:hypothetical protein BCON_0026g00240 [Botryotinia convoluta]